MKLAFSETPKTGFLATGPIYHQLYLTRLQIRVHTSRLLVPYRLKSMGDLEGRGSGRLPPGKSQVTIGLRKNNGTDPIEKPSGPIASRGTHEGGSK